MKTIGTALLLAFATTLAACSGSGDQGASAGQDVTAGPPAAAPAAPGGSAASAAAASAPGAAVTLHASTDPKLSRLGEIVGVRGVATPDSSPLNLRVIETAGGDPAMNGDQLVLVAGSSNDVPTQVFDLDLNINTLASVTFKSDRIVHLSGTIDTIDVTGDIHNGPFEADVTLSLDGAAIKNVASVSTGGKATNVTATTDPALQFYDSVFKVTGLGVGKVEARILETGGGDPAMNGDVVFLVLDGGHADPVFDLGLNIGGVDKLTATSGTELRIDGSEDFNPSDIKSRKVAYSAKFTTDSHDEVSSITFQKLQ
jgi:hypothetical protein